MQILYLGRAPRTKETLPDFCEKCRVIRHSRVVRPEKFKFLEKWENRNFGYKIVISVKKIHNLFSRSRMTKRIAPLESTCEI